jgi:arginase
MLQIQTIGIASGLAGNHEACSKGPITLRDSHYLNSQCDQHCIHLNWLPLLEADTLLSKHQAIKKLCHQAELASFNCITNKAPFIFFSGEHAYAMGIWKGAMSALAAQEAPAKKLGLIWIDAHMDAHTFVSSPSGNVHGMPVAALLGQGDAKLNEIYGDGPVLDTNCLGLFGVRSFEQAEADLLKRLNVMEIPMTDIKQKSLKGLLSILCKQVLKHADYFAISIDIDAIDPEDAPAVGVPEPGGLNAKTLCEALKQFNHDPLFLGLEVAEYSPDYDKDDKTLNVISEIVIALYGE